MKVLTQTMLEPFKWLGFVALNRLADKRGAQGRATLSIHYPPEPNSVKQERVWVFCSTIGEVNACKPLLDEIYRRAQLILISDRRCYFEGFRRHYPDAVVVELSGCIDDGERLAAQLPPNRFIVCEIPVLPVDAPCRLSYGVLRAARRAGADCTLVNGWLYHYQPSCRIDKIESRLFAIEFLLSFRVVTVQTEEVKEHLVALGLPADRVAVTGNMKFDVLGEPEPPPLESLSQQLVEQLQMQDRPLLVAGCLTDIWEYELVIAAFAEALQHNPSLFMVLAPRHPEYPEQMSGLRQLLGRYGLQHVYKSQLKDLSSLISYPLMVLDTFGELRGFYSHSAISYVGVNHNVLEPLGFGRQVVVATGWDETYPSYPVYLLTRELQLLEEVTSAAELTSAMLREARILDGSLEVRRQLEALSGALDRNLALLFG